MQPLLLADLAEQRDDEAAFTRIGLVLLDTDLTTERDFADLFRAPGMRLHVTRLHYANPVTPANLRAMAPRLRKAAALLPPETPLAAAYYACASGSVYIGDQAVAAAIREGARQPETFPVITPVTAVLEALQVLQARRISMLTPYTPQTSLPVAQHFVEHGIEVLSLACLGLQDDRDMARVTPQAICEAAMRASHPEAQALFISCTALRATEAVGVIEEKLQIPVLASNQAAAWSIMRRCHLQPPFAGHGWGRLFSLLR